MECDIQDYIIEDIAASILLSHGSHVLEETSCHVTKTLKQPYKRPSW